jgi:copper chaperone CopZ
MKKILYLILIFVPLIACSPKATNLSYVTEKFTVYGNCDMCKTHIESAVSVPGVKKANWNMSSHILIVEFAPAKVSLDQLHQKIAASGYDTDKRTASNSSYAKLPTCCKYERPKSQ